MEIIVIQRAIIISFIVIAIWCVMLEGMLLGGIRKLKIPEWMEGPLYNCCVCSTPYYGSILYWIFFHESLKDWVLVILVAMGIATIFVKIKKN